MIDLPAPYVSAVDTVDLAPRVGRAHLNPELYDAFRDAGVLNLCPGIIFEREEGPVRPWVVWGTAWAIRTGNYGWEWAHPKLYLKIPRPGGQR